MDKLVYKQLQCEAESAVNSKSSTLVQRVYNSVRDAYIIKAVSWQEFAALFEILVRRDIYFAAGLE